jgi:hypothetical protein
MLKQKRNNINRRVGRRAACGVVTMNSSDIADTIFEWFLQQTTKPPLAELERRLGERAEKMPAYVYANAKRKLFDRINSYQHRFLFEEPDHAVTTG